jgi:hypothetical protein
LNSLLDILAALSKVEVYPSFASVVVPALEFEILEVVFAFDWLDEPIDAESPEFVVDLWCFFL